MITYKLHNFFSKIRVHILTTIIRLKQNENHIHYINSSETLPAPLSRDEEQNILQNILQDESFTRDSLIVHNLRLVVYIAKKFESPTANIEDLISIGTIGLIKAVRTFRPEKNIKLATYASRCIENEILMFLRKNTQLKNEISIDEPLNVDREGNELLLSDILGNDPNEINQNIEKEVEKSILISSLSKLSKRERDIIVMRFGICGENEHTQKQVAQKLGISQSYISRLEKKIIRKLKKDLEKSFA